EGKAVFLVAEEGNKPAPDGDYILADGRSIQVKGGMIEAVKEAAGDEKQKMQTEIDYLNAQLKEKDEAFVNKSVEADRMKAELENIKKETSAIKSEFEKIRNMAIGSSGVNKKPITEPAQTIPYFENIAQKIKSKI
ncbi:MAG: DUF724 domain-containing protein, partial [Mycobacteriaceae bacterium]|nr:DUF724 domain-containing protein [Mycobacteriaceae bacterium]